MSASTASVSDMSVSTITLDTYIQQLTNTRLDEIIDEHTNKINTKSKECSNAFYPPDCTPMKEIDYLILGTDSREKITNYVYRGMLRYPPTNSKKAELYIFYYIDEFANLHSVQYNDLKLNPENPRKITYNLTNAASGNLTKMKSRVAINFIRRWTMELPRDIAYSKNMYFVNNATAEAYVALENNTIDAEGIAHLRYQALHGLDSVNDIKVPNSTLQFSNLDLLYRVFCAVDKIVNDVYYTLLSIRDRNFDYQRQLCFIEAAQAGLNRSRYAFEEKQEEFTNFTELTVRAIEHEREQNEQMFLVFANKLKAIRQANCEALVAREAEIESAQIALNESRDRFDIHVAITQRDLDKVAAEKAEQATLVATLATSLALAEHRESAEEYSNQVFINTKAREKSLLAREARLFTKTIAVDAAQVALDIARSKFESNAESKTKELKEHEAAIVRDTHQLYSRECELIEREKSISESELHNKNMMYGWQELVSDKADRFNEQEELLLNREQELEDRINNVYMQEHDNDNTRDMLWELQEELADKASELNKREALIAEHEQTLNTREQALDARDDVLHEIECAVNTRESELDNQEILLTERRIALEDRDVELDNKHRALEARGSMLALYEATYNRERDALIARENNFKEKLEAHTVVMRNVSRELSNIIKPLDPLPIGTPSVDDSDE